MPWANDVPSILQWVSPSSTNRTFSSLSSDLVDSIVELGLAGMKPAMQLPTCCLEWSIRPAGELPVGDWVERLPVLLNKKQWSIDLRLPLTFPKRLQDTPSYLDFPGEQGKVRYSEGLFVGYRYYDVKEVEPLFPFGHGLSYSDFGK
jgi:hypothetical protein